MKKSNIFRYQYMPSEIGVQIRLLLPKKLSYTGPLYSTVIHGLTKFSFTDYYRKNKTLIRQVANWRTPMSDFDPAILQVLDHYHANIFMGLSVYEVDGAFRFTDENCGGTKRPNLSDERTFVVCSSFLPDYAAILREVNANDESQPVDVYAIADYVKQFLGIAEIHGFSPESFDKQLAERLNTPTNLALLNIHTDEQAQRLCRYLKRWVYAINFFTYGFLITELTKQLLRLYGQGVIQYLEAEIWVESLWGINIKRTILYQN